MKLSHHVQAAVILSFASMGLHAQTAAPKPLAKPVAAKPAPKPATPRQQLKAEAAGLALAVETTQAINEAQLAIAGRVLTGKADCEFNQQVEVVRIDDKPGHFRVGFKNVSYTMVPEETSTGAVRLEDKRAGVVWLQIPTKSMLMNHKIGQRMVDACTQSEQRVAVDAAKTAPRTSNLQ